MKFIITFILILLIVSTFPKSSFSITITPTAKPLETPTPTPINLLDKLEKIKLLKEKVATKVAQLRMSEKSAIFGTVTEVEDEVILLSSPKEKEISVTINEDTAYFTVDANGKRDNTTLSKIKETNTLTVFGYLDKPQKTMEAKYIYVTQVPHIHLIGKIADIDRKNFTITLKTIAQEEWIIDIETYSKTQDYTKEKKIEKGGFSKLILNDVIHVTASLNTKEKNRASALRIIKFVQFSSTDLIPTTSLSPTPTP